MTDINWTTTGHPRGTSMQAWVDNPGHSDILVGPDDKWVSLDPWANTRTVAKWEEGTEPPEVQQIIEDTVYLVTTMRQAFCSACQVIEEMAGDIERWREMYVAMAAVARETAAENRRLMEWRSARPGPDWHWIPGHWRRYSGKAKRTFEGDLAQKMQDPEFAAIFEREMAKAEVAIHRVARCEWEPERWEI